MAQFSRQSGSFGGTDIKAVIGSVPIGTLQGISYQITRETGPVYTMGSSDPRGFSKGKRAIAGSLVFIQFDKEPIMQLFADPDDPNRQRHFLSDIDDLRPEYNVNGDIPVNQTTVTPAGETSINTAGAPASAQESPIASAGGDQIRALPWYPDQIPPFDIVLTAASEQGSLGIMKVIGVQIMNAGYGVSIDDIQSEHSYTFVARSILPWTLQGINGIHPDMV